MGCLLDIAADIWYSHHSNSASSDCLQWAITLICTPLSDSSTNMHAAAASATPEQGIYPIYNPAL